MNFQEYSKLIPGTTVGILSDDSGNVIELIQEAYAVKKTKLYAEHLRVQPFVFKWKNGFGFCRKFALKFSWSFWEYQMS